MNQPDRLPGRLPGGERWHWSIALLRNMAQWDQLELPIYLRLEHSQLRLIQASFARLRLASKCT